MMTSFYNFWGELFLQFRLLYSIQTFIYFALDNIKRHLFLTGKLKKVIKIKPKISNAMTEFTVGTTMLW